MKKIVFLLFIIPFYGFAQLNYNDLKYLADHKVDLNIKFIQDKGYNFRSERDIGDGTKNVYYEKSKMDKTLVVMRVGPSKKTLISYVPENKANYNLILKSVKDAKYKLTDTIQKANDVCYIYTNAEYYSKFCEVKFSNDAETSYNITFYRNNVDLFR